MSRRRRTALHSVAILVLLAANVACGSDRRPDSEVTSSSEPKPAYTELPFELDSTATSIAVNGDGIYVADFGEGNELEAQLSHMSSDDGRVLLLENGATVQKEAVTRVGAPTGIALGPDESLYVVDHYGGRVMRFAKGSTTPVLLPFTGGRPAMVAVNAAGDVVVLTDRDIQILPNGAPTATVINTFTGDALTVNGDGAIYFTDGIGRVQVLDKGATRPRLLSQSTSAAGVIAMTFDTNGDRYVIEETCTATKKDGNREMCVTFKYAVRKYANGSTTATDIPIAGLQFPTSIALGQDDIFITDNKRVLKMPRP
jgi:serine/threonine-protein kinase